MANISTQVIRFYYIAPSYTSGLTDVKIDIYDIGGTLALNQGDMIEIGSTGVYAYNHDVTTTDEYFAIMYSATKNFRTSKTEWAHPYQHHYSSSTVVGGKSDRKDFTGITDKLKKEIERLGIKISSMESAIIDSIPQRVDYKNEFDSLEQQISSISNELTKLDKLDEPQEQIDLSPIVNKIDNIENQLKMLNSLKTEIFKLNKSLQSNKTQLSEEMVELKTSLKNITTFSEVLDKNDNDRMIVLKENIEKNLRGIEDRFNIYDNKVLEISQSINNNKELESVLHNGTIEKIDMLKKELSNSIKEVKDLPTVDLINTEIKNIKEELKKEINVNINTTKNKFESLKKNIDISIDESKNILKIINDETKDDKRLKQILDDNKNLKNEIDNKINKLVEKEKEISDSMVSGQISSFEKADLDSKKLIEKLIKLDDSNYELNKKLNKINYKFDDKTLQIMNNLEYNDEKINQRIKRMERKNKVK